ncbi:hypothetical protein RFM98_01770 [Mesorhizobium sp. VK9D]|uniref:hypothetical protein n=1 Tax=Mesorhizobium australafricanum TaxID=3072311 RepID=UPI002A248DAF|nr:hypothetical protein [Mesorhizobium sp. VK9D]MDX8451476.1 hypothetical protein [Mesorhizobium sp. VK9D]
MPLIRTSTSDLKNVELSSGFLPQGYETEDAAKAHIAELQGHCDLSGYDDRNALVGKKTPAKAKSHIGGWNIPRRKSPAAEAAVSYSQFENHGLVSYPKRGL